MSRNGAAKARIGCEIEDCFSDPLKWVSGLAGGRDGSRIESL